MNDHAKLLHTQVADLLYELDQTETDDQKAKALIGMASNIVKALEIYLKENPDCVRWENR